MSVDKKGLPAYISWLFESYEEMRRQKQSLAETSHRIVEYYKTQQGKYEVVIQMIGKSISFKASPEDILSKDTAIEAFSKKDIRSLTYLACENMKEPKHELIGQKFVRSLNKFFFKFRHGKSGEEIEKSAEEISADPNLIKNLHPQDAHAVGYVAANEQFKREFQ